MSNLLDEGHNILNRPWSCKLCSDYGDPHYLYPEDGGGNRLGEHLAPPLPDPEHVNPHKLCCLCWQWKRPSDFSSELEIVR